ncbi:MAG: DUF6691 family protein [Gammaproteobacteria bacterium]|nr:DUF6691 family protein [Gammaproteobacteria bacterium]
MNAIASAFLAGLLFGLGLIVSAMTDPSKVIAFLDLTGSWDPSLALVMGGAIVASWIGIRLGDQQAARPAGAHDVTPEGRGAPTLSPERADGDVPRSGIIDRQLLAGSALFGIGWGVTGFCPGPMVTGLGLGFWPAGVAALTMLIGLRVGTRFTSAPTSG